MAIKKKRLRNKQNKRNRNQPIGFFRFISGPLVFGSLFAIAVLLGYLDFKIRERFSGNIHAQPAHIYSRPITLTPGQYLSADELTRRLAERGYRPVSQIDNPGSFNLSGNSMDIVLREIDPKIATQAALAVRLGFDNRKLRSIISHYDGSELDQITLEPTLIGSLQLGAYEDRIALKLHQMPELLIQALLTMEDRDFQLHIGIDPTAIGRALWVNLRSGKSVQGGSTLTQQLVKNLFLNPQRTLSRKGLEALMAIMMEVRYSKAQILELYLNEIFLGQSGNRAVHGFALASEYYFGRSIDQLRLHETALLVGMIPAPSYYNPRRNPERALKRRNLVLKTLADVGSITRYTSETLSSLPLGVVKLKRENSTLYPAYIDYLHRQLRQYYSEEVLRGSGLKLYTSLDTDIQLVAQQGLTDTLGLLEGEKGFESGLMQGAVVVVDIRSGDILGLVGDRNSGYSGFNRAVDALRPIGSLVKPAVYLTALEQPKKYSLASLLEDLPLTLTPQGGDSWSPQNYDKDYRGKTTIIEALTRSYNVPTVRLGLELGVSEVINTMHRLGIEREIALYPSTLLGASHHAPLEMAQLYQTLANDGVRIPLRSIRAIHNSRGDALAHFPATEQRVVDQDSAFLIDYALKQIVIKGTAARLSSSFPRNLNLAGKTGTTDGYRDSWFAGFSGNLLTVVWVGRDDNKPVGLTGSSGAMRVWENIMSRLDLIPGKREPTRDIIFTSIDPGSGLLANQRCDEQVQLPFVNGYQPEEFAECAGIIGQWKNWFNIKKEPTYGSARPGTRPLEDNARRYSQLPGHRCHVPATLPNHYQKNLQYRCNQGTN